MSKPVCLVSGVGPENGTGAEIAKRFSEGDYRVAMLARNVDNLDTLAGKYEDARAYPCDVGDLDALVETVSRVKAEMGAPRVVVHNALRSTRGSILEMDPDDLEKNFRVNATALPPPRPRDPSRDAGGGRRRDPGDRQHLGHPGPDQLGLLRLDQGGAANPRRIHRPRVRAQGVHVAYFIIDAAIDTPRTRPILAPDEPDEFFAKPSAIADEMYHVAHQDRSTWSFQVELRPFGETW